MHEKSKQKPQASFTCQKILIIFTIISILSGIVNFIFQYFQQNILLTIFFYIRVSLCIPAALTLTIYDKCQCCLLMMPIHVLSIYLGIYSLPCLQEKRMQAKKAIFWSSCSRLLFDAFVAYYAVMELICAARITNCYLTEQLSSPLGAWFLYFSTAIDVLSILATLIQIVWECCLKQNDESECLQISCINFCCCPCKEMKDKKYNEELQKSEIMRIND